MSLIVTPAGQYTERQAYALLNPCRDAREWGPGDYRRVIRRGQIDVLTFLSFDWLGSSKPCWHVAVAIQIGPQMLLPVEMWQHNDMREAVRLAVELLGDAGDTSKGRWLAHKKTDDGIDLYRAASPLERVVARGLIDAMPPLPPLIDAGGIPELEALINEREMGTDSGRDPAIGTDGAAAQQFRRRKITPERIGDA